MKHRRPLLLIVLLLSAPAGWAEVYRCVENGVPRYSDRACAAGSPPLPLAAPNLMHAPPSAALAAQHERRTAAERQARESADAEWRTAHEAERERERRVRAARVRGELSPGMSALDVRSLRGDPTRIERRTRAGVAQEVWVYEGRGKTRETITLENARVVAVRGGKSRR